MGKANLKLLYLPWKIFVMYIFITLFLNFFGPWEYVEYNKVLVLVYISAFIFLGTIAFKLGIDFNLRKIKSFHKLGNLPEGNIKIANISIVISLILYLFLIVERVLIYGIPDIDGNVLETLNNAYNAKSFTFTYSYWLYSYLSVFDIIAKVLGIYHFKELKLNKKILYITLIFTSLFYTFYYDGNQKGIGDLFVYIFSASIILYSRGSKKIKIKYIFASLSLIVGALYLFISNLSERISGWGWTPQSLDGRAFANYDHWMIRYLPEELKIGGMAIFNYISNGYYGLSLCLQLPFSWSMGFGSSFAFREMITRWFNISDNSYSSPYPEIMTKTYGYDGYVNWVSIFPWLASDFTFFGAILFISLFIYFYAVAWFKSIIYGNWISIVLVAHLNIFLLYIPNNNQLFQSKTSFVATIIIFILWFKYNNSPKRNSDVI
ncbi:O-antigen polymerase [Rossellomorea sp. H39__3]